MRKADTRKIDKRPFGAQIANFELDPWFLVLRDLRDLHHYKLYRVHGFS
jgi:hypothetical protein